ncbi:hypothetical protein Bca52824_001377 [Brassica carinata]|uniref:Bulb-type lectin domain-containing protein n=1 Tax=Brassica carinata TaxID=52824 RepID=A0A8X7WIZ8_BRACI|nr:hypothetical protein Bca52824_001377 [Brassica carinata]
MNRFSVYSALLRDDGNLVLFEAEEIVWKSFDTPANSLLLNQNLKAFEMLRAAGESSRSSYNSLHMDGSGKLELRWESNITFWSIGNQEAVKKVEKIGAVLTLEGVMFSFHEGSRTWRPVWR